jgi:hypothetical protein
MTLKTLYPLTKLKLTRFCDYILLNRKFSGECFVALFFSTLAFVLCVVCHSVNYVIWLPFCQLCCLSFCELRHMMVLTENCCHSSCRDRSPDGFTTSYAISVYHHWWCEFDFWLWWGVLDTTLCNTVYPSHLCTAINDVNTPSHLCVRRNIYTIDRCTQVRRSIYIIGRCTQVRRSIYTIDRCTPVIRSISMM